MDAHLAHATTPQPTSDVAIVEHVIRAVGLLDLAEARRWLADDLVLELPFRGGGHPRVLSGPDAHAFMGLLPKLFERMDFTDVRVHGAVPSGLIVAEYASNGRTRAGASYPNNYVALFEVTSGRISRWREYFNPDVIVAAGLG
jgi:ketosteroid isomerase-like protein